MQAQLRPEELSQSEAQSQQSIPLPKDRHIVHVPDPLSESKAGGSFLIQSAQIQIYQVLTCQGSNGKTNSSTRINNH